MEPNDKEEKTWRCIACREFIYPTASICPHCSTTQTPEQWSSLRKTLKMVGGFTAVLSLVVVASQVTKLVDEMRQSKKVASELAAAAKLVWQADDPEGAMTLIKQAETIYAGLASARDLQAKIGMEYLRRLYPFHGPRVGLQEVHAKTDAQGIDGYVFESSVDKHEVERFIDDSGMYQLLASRAANSRGKVRAQHLAHLAWLVLIKNPVDVEIDVDELLIEADKADHEDVFVML